MIAQSQVIYFTDYDRKWETEKKNGAVFKVRVNLKIFADLDFDLDPNWGITPKIETLYNLSCLPDTNIEDLASK